MIRFTKPLALSALLVFSLTACAPHASTDGASTKPVVPNPFTPPDAAPKTSAAKEELAKQDAVDQTPIDLKLQCAADICGDPAHANDPSNLLRGDFSTDVATKALLKNDLQPLVEKSFDSRVAYLKAAYAKLSEKLPTLKDHKLDAAHAAAINYLWMASKVTDTMKAAKTALNKFTIDNAALAKALPDVSEADRRFLRRATLDFLNSPEFRRQSEISSLTLPAYLRRNFPKLSLKQAEQELGQELSAALKDVSQAFPEMNLQPGLGVTALVHGAELTPEVLTSAENQVLLPYLARLIKAPPTFYQAREIPVSDLVVKGRERVRAALNDQQDTGKLAQARAAGLAVCQVYLGASVAAAPTDAELDQARILTARVKDSVLRYVTSSSDLSDGAPRVASALSQLTVSYPASRQVVMGAMKRSLAEAALYNAKMAESSGQISDDALILLLAQNTYYGAPNVGNEMASLCAPFAPGGPTDETLYDLDTTNVSWETVRYPKYGVGIFAHELGHVVSYAITGAITGAISGAISGGPNQAAITSLVQVKMCTNDRHGGLTQMQPQMYDEEDFADLVAAHVLKDLASKQVASDNFGCLILGEDKTRWGVNGLKLANAEDDPDVHSPGLFRALVVQQESGRSMPKSCSDLMAAHATNAAHSCSN